MSTPIIAGRLDEQSEVENAVERLQHAGFAREHISAFYVNPQGQHDTYPIGGDRKESPGAKEAGKGVAAGATTGAAAGVAAAPLLGPVGPAAGGMVGAYVGGLIGSLSQMKDRGDPGERSEDAQNAQPVRESGMLVAVAVEDPVQEEHAVDTLRSAGASNIERAEGTIDNGNWSDFNPLAAPKLIRDSSNH